MRPKWVPDRPEVVLLDITITAAIAAMRIVREVAGPREVVEVTRESDPTAEITSATGITETIAGR